MVTFVKFFMMLVVLFLANPMSCLSQTKPEPKSESKPDPAKTVSACVDRPEMQEEITESKALVARMQNRIIMMRNSIGTIRDFELRNALQINADAWQDLLDNLKLRMARLQTVVDRCEAREKITAK